MVTYIHTYIHTYIYKYNENYINICDILKKYQDWNCIYPDRNEQWMKQLFSSK